MSTGQLSGLIDITKAGLPLAFAITLLTMVGGACLKIGGVLATYETQQTEVGKLAGEVATLQKILIDMRPEDRWRRTDQVLFCWEAERINANWRCPTVTPMGVKAEDRSQR